VTSRNHLSIAALSQYATPGPGRRRCADDRPLVLFDLGLPDGDGLALLKHLRHDRRTLPVLVFTARDALDDPLAGLDGGADDCLVKPFALAELLWFKLRFAAGGKRMRRLAIVLWRCLQHGEIPVGTTLKPATV
jgi:CheY-like chemotaxis protein